MCLMSLIAGCGDSTKAALDQQVANWREIGDILATVHDKMSMDEAEDRLFSNARKFKDASQRFQRMTRRDAARLDDYPEEKGAMESAVREVVRHVQRIKTLPGGDEFFQRIGETIGATPGRP